MRANYFVAIVVVAACGGGNATNARCTRGRACGCVYAVRDRILHTQKKKLFKLQFYLNCPFVSPIIR